MDQPAPPGVAVRNPLKASFVTRFAVLQIDNSAKGIPYGGTGEVRQDGHANYGFRNLKGALHRIEEIPELSGDASLRELVRRINGPETGLLSIGCLSAPVAEEQGHRVTGYVEFAFNSAEAISDAGHYFPIFFHFDRVLHETGYDEAYFHWELMGAEFREADAGGFTMSVTVNTGHFGTEKEARNVWSEALALLADYLASVPPQPGRPLY